MSGLPTLWNELNLGLIDGAGEVLLDDIRGVENPDTAPVQFIQNGSFNDGVGAHWRFRGNHRHSRVEPEPGNPGNFVLHLIATGPISCPRRAMVLASSTLPSPTRVNARYTRLARTSRSSVS